MNADAQGAWFGVRHEHVTVAVDGVAGGVVELELAPAEHRGHGDVHLGVCEGHAEAAAGALAETDHVAGQVLAVGRLGVVQPALGPESEAVREEILVVRDGEVGHGNDGSGREHVGFVRDGLRLRDSGSALRGAVG